MEAEFSEIPIMEDFDKLTDDATRKYKGFIKLIQAGKVELEQIQATTMEKIAVL